MARSEWGIGLVGLGGIAQQHLEGYRRRGLNVIGGADINPEQAAATQERFHLSVVTQDYKTLIDHPDVRVVDINVPHTALETRLPVVEYAARQKKAIFIQKPLMSYLDWAKQLVEAAEKQGVPMMVNQNSVFAPGFLVAEQYLRDPEIMGRIYYCQIENRAWVDIGPERWYAKDKRWVHADMAIHHFALVRHWFGDVDSVYAILDRDASQQHVTGDALGVVTVRFKSGVQAVLINNWCYRGNKARPHSGEEVVIQGEKGCITCNAQDVHIKLANGQELMPEVSGSWFPDAFGTAMAHFVDALDAGQSFHCEARDNLKSVAMIEATYLSAMNNRVVHLDEILES